MRGSLRECPTLAQVGYPWVTDLTSVPQRARHVRAVPVSRRRRRPVSVPGAALGRATRSPEPAPAGLDAAAPAGPPARLAGLDAAARRRRAGWGWTPLRVAVEPPGLDAAVRSRPHRPGLDARRVSRRGWTRAGRGRR